jgi:hypothetical protein
MTRKAGIWIAAAAVAATAAVGSAVVFGAGASGPGVVKRAGVLHLRARIEAPSSARAAAATAARHKPPVVYGATRPQSAPPATTAGPTTTSVALGGCPRGYHITNGSVAALHATQAQFLTIDGSGPAAGKRGVKRWFVDFTNSLAAPNVVSIIGFIVCQR